MTYPTYAIAIDFNVGRKTLTKTFRPSRAMEGVSGFLWWSKTTPPTVSSISLHQTLLERQVAQFIAALPIRAESDNGEVIERSKVKSTAIRRVPITLEAEAYVNEECPL